MLLYTKQKCQTNKYFLILIFIKWLNYDYVIYYLLWRLASILPTVIIRKQINIITN